MKIKKRKRRPRNKRGRGIYVLPNLVTTASMFCGFFAIVSSINGEFTHAAVAIMIAMICDGLDGRLARLTNTTSGFGVQYDSLADLVSFGVAPSVLAFLWALTPYGRLGWLAAFLFVACGALRLARFNVQVGTGDKRFFTGLPIPAAAVMVAATVLFCMLLGWTEGGSYGWAILAMIYVLSFLMVSNLKYFSFKDLSLINRKSFNLLVAAVLLLILMALKPTLFLFLIMACYIIHGPILTIAMMRKNPTEEEGATPPVLEDSPGCHPLPEGKNTLL
ncbi:MAG: CDP-diacylglycerol--serine O-phosphatidyltransferase [Deltaproteobacteria bacterium]|nr:CDP-diacylglycerol--serine O-phosphatidyltransferase [Deltaproteobacteria bacterium]